MILNLHRTKAEAHFADDAFEDLIEAPICYFLKNGILAVIILLKKKKISWL
jgi:hypothetical protein